MQIKRPNIPVSAPKWNLNKVLQFLDSVSGSIPKELSLQKTVFLSLLATGWRISELHACAQTQPVRSLQEYLRLTSQIRKGSLFIHPSTRKSLSIHQLSKYICKIILQADPDTGTKVHDLPKYAASCTLAENMEVSEMVNAFQWSSPNIFWKFYLAPTVPLTVPVILPATSEVCHQSMTLETLTAPAHQETVDSSPSS